LIYPISNLDIYDCSELERFRNKAFQPEDVDFYFNS